MNAEIYFAESGGRIKIGTTTRGVANRLAAISASLPRPLRLIGAIAGHHDLERAIHLYVWKWRLKGEWFKDCFDLRKVIESIISNGPAALGIEPHVGNWKTSSRPKEQTEDELKQRFGRVARVIWPDDTVQQLTQFSGYPESECERWLSGEECPPHLVRGAFAALVVQACVS